MTRGTDIASRIAVALFAIAAVALVGYKLAAQIAVGPGWDSFAFLANAAAFAGRGIGYSEPARPPLLSLIAAIPIAFGAMDQRTIQFVDAALTLFTLGGFFLLLRRRFSRIVSAGASVALLMAPPVWQWVGVGYTDLAAMGLGIWALYFAVRATEDDSRFYYLAFPTALAVLLMRLNAALFVVPFAIWLALRARPFRDAKRLAGGLLAALCTLVPVGIYYSVTTGNAFYPFVAGLRVQAAGNLATAQQDLHSFAGAVHTLAAPGVLGALTLAVLALALFGLADAVWRSLRERHVTARRLLAAAAVIALAYWVGRHGFAASQAAVATGVYLVWRLAAAERRESNAGIMWEVPAELALDAAMMAWLLSFFWFHETWTQKVTRYYITMAPSVIYFTILGWRQLIRGVGVPVGSPESEAAPGVNYGLRSLAWTPLIALLVMGLAIDATATSWSPDPSVLAARQTAQWLARQPDVATARVYSDLWPMTAWYLQRDASAMPFYTSDTAVEHELDVNDARYYVTLKTAPLTRYPTAFKSPMIRVVAAEGTPPRLPRVLYLGGGWDHYLEQLDGYRIALDHDAGDYDMLGSAYLDAYNAEQLAKYRTIAAFAFEWHDRSTAEKRLQQWVSDGGTLVIDASGNLQQPTSLGDSVLFDTVISRTSLPRDSRIEVDPAFAAAHPEAATIAPTPFVADGGGPWYGASYAALPGSVPLRVIARANGRPLIVERDWGSGHVIWIGCNLAWHAYQTSNGSEAALISAILDEATRTNSRMAGTQIGTPVAAAR